MAKLIIGNWKMNPSDLLSAKKIFARVKSTVAKAKRTKVIMCVPYVYLYSLLGSGNGHIALGAQDAFWEEKGAFTGKISTRIIRAAGARWDIGAMAGLTRLDPRAGVVFGLTKEFRLWK